MVSLDSPPADKSRTNEYFHLNSELNKYLKHFATSFDGLIQSFKSRPEAYNSPDGISFLALKNMLLIEYLTNLMQVVFLKTDGQKIEANPAVVRLAEIRTVLEKSKSIELKLKYQIDKLLKIAANTSTEEHDPLSFKANLDNFGGESGAEENDKEESEEEGGDEDKEESGEKSR